MKTPRLILWSAGVVAVAMPSSATVVRGRVFDLADSKSALSGVRVIATWTGGGPAESVSLPDGTYSLDVPAHTQVSLTFGGGLYLETTWALKTGEPAEEHPHDDMVMRLNAFALHYWRDVGKKFSQLSGDKQRATWKEATAIPTESKVALAKSWVDTQPNAINVVPELAELKNDNPADVRQLSDLVVAYLSTRKSIPSKSDVEKVVKLPSPFAVADVLAAPTTTQDAGKRESYLKEIEALWDRPTRDLVEKNSAVRLEAALTFKH